MPWIFFWIWWVSIGWEHTTKGMSLESCLMEHCCTVENESFFVGYVEQVYDVGIMVSGHPSHHMIPSLSCMANTPGHWATMSSILIWKMSWAHCESKWYTSEICTCLVVCWTSWGVELPLSGVSPKNTLLPSTLENFVAPVRTWAISSRVGA